jgi:predicted transcriptional regulator
MQEVGASGEVLRQMRRRTGLSLRELAARAGTSAATLSNYERGLKEPRLSTLSRLVASAGAELVVHVRYPEPAGAVADQARAREIRDALGLAESIARGKRIEQDRHGVR